MATNSSARQESEPAQIAPHSNLDTVFITIAITIIGAIERLSKLNVVRLQQIRLRYRIQMSSLRNTRICRSKAKVPTVVTLHQSESLSNQSEYFPFIFSLYKAASSTEHNVK